MKHLKKFFLLAILLGAGSFFLFAQEVSQNEDAFSDIQPLDVSVLSSYRSFGPASFDTELNLPVIAAPAKKEVEKESRFKIPVRWKEDWVLHFGLKGELAYGVELNSKDSPDVNLGVDFRNQWLAIGAEHKSGFSIPFLIGAMREAIYYDHRTYTLRPKLGLGFAIEPEYRFILNEKNSLSLKSRYLFSRLKATDLNNTRTGFHGVPNMEVEFNFWKLGVELKHELSAKSKVKSRFFVFSDLHYSDGAITLERGWKQNKSEELNPDQHFGATLGIEWLPLPKKTASPTVRMAFSFPDEKQISFSFDWKRP